LVFEDLNDNHVEAAARLALAEYFEERAAVPVLPGGEYFDLICNSISGMTGAGLGVAAIEDGQLAGFLTCYPPRENFFGTAMGTFSPIHGHGAVKTERKRLYSKLYQNVAAKWVKQGILSHAIALYPHDRETVESFFWNGFGLRCVDAVRDLTAIPCETFPNSIFGELSSGEIAQLVPLKNLLIEHSRSTPMFMPLSRQDIRQVKEENARRDSRYFAAWDRDRVIAFLEIMASGENFAAEDPGMANICGAFILPEYRGTGIFTRLLSRVIETLRDEGYLRCGVDFESFNLSGSGFWLKHFTPYTYSVVRRIDERIYRPE
jgi:GNAT superfamily N-acetyltransferase